jgi:hypothetical protein
MVEAAWRSFGEELARWRDAGNLVDFWWRDDDAARRTTALSRLFDLAGETSIPLALAVVPGGCEKLLLEGVDPCVVALQHGVDHGNRAQPDTKKTEFPATESVDATLRRLRLGWTELFSATGDRALPVLAPPWNRITAGLVPHLVAAGYSGLSTYGARVAAEPLPGLLQVNTHVDLIDWKAGRRFAGDAAVLQQAVRHLAMRRLGQADPTEPTGWLTHHAVHDEAAWRFLDRLFKSTDKSSGVRWVRPADLFSRDCDTSHMPLDPDCAA